MTKFSDMKYERPDFDREFGEMKGLLETMREAKEEGAFFGALAALEKKTRAASTQGTLC